MTFADGRSLPLVQRLLLAVCLLVFLASWTYGMFDRDSRGSTSLGKVESGRYYLGSHGHLTEVTRDEWESRRLRDQIYNAAFVLGSTSMGVIALIAWRQDRRKQLFADASNGAKAGSAFVAPGTRPR